MNSSKIVSDLTKIIHLDNGEFELHIVVMRGRGLISSNINLVLDKAMRAEIPVYDPSEKNVFSLNNISMTRETPGLKISNNRRILNVSIPSCYINKPSLVTIKIPFRWTNAFIVPKTITIRWSSSLLGFIGHRGKLEGLNLQHTDQEWQKITSFLDTKNDVQFLFPGKSYSATIPYESLSPLIPRLQNYPDTTVWGTTWPHELKFWLSKHGTKFLAKQLILYRQFPIERPRRIAVCPFSIGVAKGKSNAFIAELEAQHQCGVDIRIHDQSEVHSQFNYQCEAMLCLGGSLGISYRNVKRSIQKTEATVFFEKDSVGSMKDLYDDTQRHGIYWNKYKAVRNIDYSAQSTLQIKKRIAAINNAAKQIKKSA